MTDIFTKYVLIKPSKGKWTRTISYGFIAIVNESKPNKLCFDQVKEFYNNFMQKW